MVTRVSPMRAGASMESVVLFWGIVLVLGVSPSGASRPFPSSPSPGAGSWGLLTTIIAVIIGVPVIAATLGVLVKITINNNTLHCCSLFPYWGAIPEAHNRGDLGSELANHDQQPSILELRLAPNETT